MNKYELAKKITQLEGLTSEEKASLVELLRSQKKYGLVWEDKPEEIETRLVDELPVLTEVPERAIVSESPDAPNHILIEGDNLEALTALAYTHEGKIDVIYIDPPYNTGNKDFVYNDSFVDREDGYRHSKWLSFMNKRLQIAKSLLSSGGVIFISIDDNEQAQLKLLCDEILGEGNCIAQVVVASNSAKNNAKFISVTHEYLLCYAKDKETLPTNWAVLKNNINQFNKIAKKLLNSSLTPEEIHSELLALTKYPKYYEFDHYTYVDKRGPFRASDLTAPGSTAKYDIIHPKTKKTCKTGTRGWGYSEKVIKDLIEKDFIYFGEDETVMPQLKNYLSENEKSLPKSIVFFDSQASTKWMKSQHLDFPFPKALDYIKYIGSMYPNCKATVLDFFAGSGTTLHATMQLNAEDGGHRKCILVTNNENNICENVTYERNKRVIQGYTTPKGEEVEGLHDNNLRYYRTTLLSRDKSVKNMRQLVRLATDMLCIKNDVYTEAEFCGKKINPNIARYFDNGQGNRMLVIYEERAIQLLVQLMAQTEDDGIKTMVYVFSPGADPYTDDFEDIAERVKLCALPSAIYEAYKRVLPKRKPKFLDEALREMKTQAEAEANAQQTLDFGENDNMNEEGGEA